MLDRIRRSIKVLFANDEWAHKQLAASPARYYGDGGTIHSGTDLDVEVCNGEVVAVWFRCQYLPFRASTVKPDRATEMKTMYAHGTPQLTGVEIID